MTAVFEQWGRLGNDECARNARDQANQSIEQYTLYVPYQQLEPECPEDKVRVPSQMLQYPNMRSKVGFGHPDACAIDLDPTLLTAKNGTTRDRCRQQLFTRVFTAVPKLRPGNPDAGQESELLQGTATSTLECSSLAPRRTLTEANYDRFVPLVPPLQSTIQNPDNLVETWVRGGEHTREFVHTDDFKKMCRQK